MAPSDLFRIVNAAVLPGWMLLIFLPRWKWTQTISAIVLPSFLALVYLTVLALHWGETQGSFSSLAGVRALFANDWVLVGGWIHYLAFDLFTGSWEVRDALRLRIPLVLLVPCLCLTFLFGPIGLVGYMALRYGVRRNNSGVNELDRI